MRKLVIAVFLIFIFKNVSAQLVREAFGARSLGLANANVALKDTWSMFNNVAGISAATDPVIGVGILHRYNMAGLNSYGLTYIQPFRFGNTGLSVASFGDEVYSERDVGLGFANKIGFVRLGVKAGLLQVNATGFGTHHSVSFSMGGIIELIPKLDVGLHVENLNQPSLGVDKLNTLPIVMKVGIMYRPAPSVSCLAQVSSTSSSAVRYALGIEYIPIKAVSIRGGVASNPLKYHGGVGFAYHRFDFQYALASLDVVGQQHHFTCSFTLGKQKSEDETVD